MRSVLYALVAFFWGLAVALGSVACAGESSSEDIQSVLDRQVAEGRKTVTIPSGRHLLTPRNGRHLVFSGLTNVTVNAVGAELVCTAYANAIVVTNCSGLIVRGLTVDYDPLPWTQGRVISVDAKTLSAEVELAEGYPVCDVLTFKNQYFDGRTRELLDLPGAVRFERIGARRLRAFWKKGARLPQPDALFVTNVAHPDMEKFKKGPDDYSRAIHAVVQVGSRETLFEDVTVWASPWFAFFERDCDGTVYRRCRVDRRPSESDPVRRGMGRLRAGNSDAFHCTRPARGPKLVDCTARYMEDDGVNVHGLYHFISSSKGADLRVLAQGGMNIAAGDAVELVDSSGRLLPDATVMAVRPDDPSEVTADELAKLRARDMRPYFREHWRPQAYRVTLDRIEPLAFGGVIVSLAHAGRGFEVSHCKLGHTRARGVLARARDGLIAHNEIENTGLPAVLLVSEPWWLEGGNPLGTRIESNRIAGCRVTPSVQRRLAPYAPKPLEGTVRGCGAEPPKGYVPPLLANGELAMTVDWPFGVRARHVSQYSQGIYLEGRRVSHPRRELLPQGRWSKKLLVDGKPLPAPASWEQHLDIKTGVVTSRLSYDNGLEFTGEAFVPFSQNTIALKLSVTSRASSALDVTLGVNYDAPVHPRIVGTWRTNGVTRIWGYRSYGHSIVDGETTVCGADARFSLAPGMTRTETYFIAFSDTMRRHPGLTADYAALRAAHVAAWNRYWDESSVALPDPELQRMWEMAGYHLRINATPWSFPVGILDSHWQGLYFGFDEMYMHQGLVSAGHVELARREPDYRFGTLKPALARNRYGDSKQFVKYGARWYWESLEDGQSEGTVPGEWMDHIFHMATIAKCAWQQWQYGRDLEWFATRGYPVVYECARFFRNNWVYEDTNGDTYIGKCCDLERLGPSRDHPFMTTCGAIYTLRAAADACELLKTNGVDAIDFRRVADRLERSLPCRDGRYVACREDAQESMATLAGFFPFPIFLPDHAPQREAVRHFIENGRNSGNMYPTGKKICPWYAGTMSAASSWMEDRVEPYRWLKEAFSACGLFGEYFEINEPGSVFHPWFATAAGNCLYAINQMLLCDRGGDVYLGFTVPSTWKDYAFTLPSRQGVAVSMRVKGGRLAGLHVTPRPGVAGTLRLVVRPELVDGVSLERPIVRLADRAIVTWTLPQ